MNAQESHGWNLFAAQSWNMGISDHFKRNEIKRALLDVLCLFWIPSSKYRKSKFHSKQMKHFASQIFLRSYPATQIFCIRTPVLYENFGEQGRVGTKFWEKGFLTHRTHHLNL